MQFPPLMGDRSIVSFWHCMHVNTKTRALQRATKGNKQSFA